MRKFEKLSVVHGKIWFLNDFRDERALRKNVEEYVKLRNSDLLVSKCISDSYILYGLMQDGKLNTSHCLLFKKIFFCFLKAYTLNKELHPYLQAHFTMLWWKESFYKNQIKSLRYLKIILAIYLLHLAKLGVIRIGAVLYCSRLLILAGYHGHDKKNFEVCKHYLKKYWEHVPPDVNFISF